MISEEIKKLDIFAKKDRLQKILNLDFMSEELLEVLIEDFPPFSGKINGNCKDLTAISQNEYRKTFPNQKHKYDTGSLTALYMLDDQKQSGHKNWLCWNTRINDVYGSVEVYNFTSLHVNGNKTDKVGKSYAALGNVRHDQRVDLTGKEFGYIKVIKETGNRQIGDARIEWLCHCDACGKDFVKDSHSLPKIVSCGCLNQYSNEVVLIRKLLEENNIKYKQEYTFENCKDINPLPFDFIIEDNNGKAYLLEYDGEQHFKSVEHWGRLETTRAHDLIKNHYCFDNNIRLLRIPFNATYTLDDILLKTNKFLLTRENEKEYYGG